MSAFPVAHLPAPGSMTVDWEERLDVARLRAHRLERARAALEASELGALLLFDMNNIRYVTSTTIGEWARDKLMRWALLTRTGGAVSMGLRLCRTKEQAVRAVARPRSHLWRHERAARRGRPVRGPVRAHHRVTA